MLYFSIVATVATLTVATLTVATLSIRYSHP